MLVTPHHIYEARSAVKAVGSPGSTRVLQQPAKANELQLQHEEVYMNGSHMQIELRRTGRLLFRRSGGTSGL